MNLNSQDALAQQFWQQKQVYGVNAVYFGNSRGGYVGAEPLNKIAITKNFTGGQFLFYDSNAEEAKSGTPKLVKCAF